MATPRLLPTRGWTALIATPRIPPTPGIWRVSARRRRVCYGGIHSTFDTLAGFGVCVPLADSAFCQLPSPTGGQRAVTAPRENDA